MRIAICDDTTEHREGLRSALSRWALVHKLTVDVQEYGDGSELLAQSSDSLRTLDVIFLDIYMPTVNGIEASRALRSQGVQSFLVFFTTTTDFAVEGYEVDASSYLVKPVKVEKFYATMDRILQQYSPRSLLFDDRLVVADDIVFAESSLKIVRLHLKEGSCIEVRDKLDGVAEKLESSNFLRCHKSFIVNMNYVARVKDSNFVMVSGALVPIRQKDISELRKAYYDYLKTYVGIKI